PSYAIGARRLGAPRPTPVARPTEPSVAMPRAPQRADSAALPRCPRPFIYPHRRLRHHHTMRISPFDFNGKPRDLDRIERHTNRPTDPSPARHLAVPTAP